MDLETIKKYDEETEEYLKDWMPVTPAALKQLVTSWFRPGSSVLDIGSGSGRDVHWLVGQGYKAEGVDASRGLLAVASARYPSLKLRFDSLPDLVNTHDSSFDNVLCSAVLMHLSAEQTVCAVKNILRIVKPGGRVICSVRPSREGSERESDGRLYTEMGLQKLADSFAACGGKILLQQTSSSEKIDRTWHTVVVEKRK